MPEPHEVKQKQGSALYTCRQACHAFRERKLQYVCHLYIKNADTLRRSEVGFWLGGRVGGYYESSPGELEFQSPALLKGD